VLEAQDSKHRETAVLTALIAVFLHFALLSLLR